MRCVPVNYANVFLEIVEEVGAGHGPAGEEIPTHPIRSAFRLKLIYKATMTEYMHEELTRRLHGS